MRATHGIILFVVAVLSGIIACESDPSGPALADVTWSEPVSLGSVINTSVIEGSPALSPDGLALYFDSDRTDLPGAVGGRDIYVARRDCLTCEWQTPANLGDAYNSPFNDGSPTLSADGLLLFFITHGEREGCASAPCHEAILVAARDDAGDDFSWGAPVSVGAAINNGERANEPAFVVEGGQAMLYFERGTTNAGFDLYRAPIGDDGVATGPAEPVAVLNRDGLMDAGPTLSGDGLELYYYRADGTGGDGCSGLDIWRATRTSPTAAWDEPLRVGPPISVECVRDLTPFLSPDGARLLFASDRDDPGNWDLYISERVSGP